MNNELNEKIFDLVLKEALQESLDRELQEIDEMVATMPEQEPTPELDRKIKKLARSIGRRERIRKCKPICVKIIKVLVVAAAIMGVFFCGLLTQPAIYTAVQNFIQNIFD